MVEEGHAVEADRAAHLICAEMSPSHVVNDGHVGVAQLGADGVHVGAESRGPADDHENVIAWGRVEVLGHHLLVDQAHAHVVPSVWRLINHVEGLHACTHT